MLILQMPLALLIVLVSTLVGLGFFLLGYSFHKDLIEEYKTKKRPECYLYYLLIAIMSMNIGFLFLAMTYLIVTM